MRVSAPAGLRWLREQWLEGEIKLTYARFAKACYVFFAVAVLAAVLKLSVSGAEPALLRVLPAASTATAVEPAKAAPKGPDEPRLGSFSDDGETERLRAVFSRTASREDASRGDRLEEADDGSGRPVSGTVFRRPSLGRGPSAEPVCGDLGDAPGSSRAVFPLPEEYFDSYDDTWGAARPQGGHEGTDLMSPAGTPEYALTDGKIVGVAGSDEDGWNTLGGYTVMLEAAHDIGPIKKGDLFYYAHMQRESALPIGAGVRAGQRIGTVGDTGEGRPVTRGKFPPHLHLGWYDANFSDERSEVESGAMNPYPLLVWLERNGGAVSGGTDAPYCEAPQGPNPAPSTGEPDWPVPSTSNERPDLDTGEDGGASPADRKEDHQRPDRNDGDRSGGEAEKDREADTGEGNETGEVGEPREEAKKLSLRKGPRAKLDALVPEIPSVALDRDVPEDRPGDERNDDKDHDDRKDGGRKDKARGEEPQNADRPDRARPKGKQDVPPDGAPDPPAPVAAPDRRPRPVSEKPAGEEPAGGEPADEKLAEKEPETEKPPNVVPEMPAIKPVPPTDAEETEADVALPREEAVPMPDEAGDASGGETVEVSGAGEEE